MNTLDSCKVSTSSIQDTPQTSNATDTGTVEA